MDDHGSAAGRRLDAADRRRGLEPPRHLDAEIDVHAGRRMARCVVIEEDVVAVAAQAGMAAQESPDLVQGRSETGRNVGRFHARALGR
jgi:hypothetical protein